VSLTASGGGVSQADLDREIRNIEDDAWSVVPTVTLGMTFKVLTARQAAVVKWRDPGVAPFCQLGTAVPAL